MLVAAGVVVIVCGPDNTFSIDYMHFSNVWR